MVNDCLASIGRICILSALLLMVGCANTLREWRATNYLDNGHYDEAIAVFSTVLEYDPDYAAAYYNRGTAYANKREYDLAIADYDKAIELRPKYWKAYANRGTAFLMINDYDTAVADLTRALEIKPGLGLVHCNRARAYYSMQQYEKAWYDSMNAKRLGFTIEPDFLFELRKATGRDL